MTEPTSSIREFCFSGEDTPARLLALWCATNLTTAEIAEFRRILGDIILDGTTKSSVETMIQIIETAKFVTD